MRVFGGFDQSRGVVFLVTAGYVQTGDDHFQLRKEIVLEIETLFKDIYLDAAEKAEGVAVVLELPIDGSDFPELFLNARFVKSVGLKGCLGMVRDGPLGEAETAHVLGNLLEAFVAVTPVAVIVQGSLEVGPLNKARDITALGGGEFTAILA